ncbi:unnamed protein product, partial [Musa acuminata subsp. burmannicoides]
LLSPLSDAFKIGIWSWTVLPAIPGACCVAKFVLRVSTHACGRHINLKALLRLSRYFVPCVVLLLLDQNQFANNID